MNWTLHGQVFADAALTKPSYFGHMGNDSVAPIRLFMLGDARIETRQGEIEPTAEVVFAAALYLILERNEPVSRRVLEAILWPKASPTIASHRLRQTLLRLRRLGISVEAVGKSRLSLLRSSAWVDFEAFVTAKHEKSSETDRLLLLPGYGPTFSEAFQDWLDHWKDRIYGSMSRVMLDMIARGRGRGEWAEVEALASHVLRFAPYNEEATLALAEAYAMRGAKLEGMRILDVYLSEIGNSPADLRLPASVMRKRIADRISPRGSSVARSTPMVGRASIMEMLGEMLGSVRKGKSRSCLVWGEAGIGKSRLLSELAGFAGLQGISTLRVQCRPSDPNRPLSVFVDLVPLLRSLRGAIGCSADTIAYLDRITKHRALPSDIESEEVDAQFVYARVERALFDLIDAVGEENTLIILIEDVHWIDPASLKVLRQMIEWCDGHRVLFALTAREHPRWLQASSSVTEIRLAPLSTDAAAEVILAVIRQHGKEIDSAYLDWCVRVAEGNPFFLEELAQQWLESGSQHTPPPSVTSVLEQRISRLTPEALQLLQTVAVLEDHASFERIEEVLRREPYRLLESINELADAGMLAGGKNAIERSPYLLHPRHDLIATAALHRLTAPARVFLHRRVATTLERQVDIARSTALLWDSAKHWQLAGDSPRALELARSCGFHLLELGLPAEAAEVFNKVLEYCSSSRETLEILKAQAKAHEQSSSWVAVREVEGVVRSIMTQIGQEQSHDELELMSLRAAWKTEDDEAALSRLSGCLRAPDASPDHRAKAGVMALMLQDLTCQHDQMPATFSIVKGLSRATGASSAAQLEADLVYHTLCGSLPSAVAAAETLITIQREKEDEGYLFRHLCNASVTYRTAGLFDRAVGCLTEAAEIAKSHRLPKSLLRALPMLAHLALERGLICDARHWYDEMAKQDVQPDDLYVNLDAAALGVRLSLAERKLGDTSLSALQLPQILRAKASQRRAYASALSVATILATGESLSDESVAQFEAIHIYSRRCIAQAFCAYVLFVALERVGKFRRAKELLDEYNHVYRRETWEAKVLFDQVRAQLTDSDTVLTLA